MLAPEVWNLKPPQHNIKIIDGELNEKNIKTLNEKISSHYFNRVVTEYYIYYH